MKYYNLKFIYNFILIGQTRTMIISIFKGVKYLHFISKLLCQDFQFQNLRKLVNVIWQLCSHYYHHKTMQILKLLSLSSRKGRVYHFRNN